MPIRAIVWCHKTNIIMVGCVGGSLFAWNTNDIDATFIDQLDNNTVNILRYAHGKIFIGTSDGEIKIINEDNLALYY